MKRSSIVLMIIALGLIAMPNAALADVLVLDGDAAMTGAGLNPAGDDDNGAPTPPATLNPNGILDSDEFALITTILADAGSPFHVGVHAAYVTNLAHITAVIPIPAYRPPLALHMTLGDANTVAAMVQFAGNYGMTIVPASCDLTQASVLGRDADPDADGLTNKAEYDLIAGTGGPASAKRTQYLADALTPAGPPPLDVTITADPGVTLIVGDSVTFNAVATGGTAPYTNYAWSVTGFGVIASGPSASATVDPVLLLYNGLGVSCEVTDSAPANATSNTLVLSVSPPPPLAVTITADPSTTVLEGDSVTFNAVATGGTAPYTNYAWSVTGFGVIASGPSASATVDPVLLFYSGLGVSCEVTDSVPANATSNTLVLTVTPRPALSISDQPDGGTGYEGGSFTFTVAATGGYPPYSYQWKKGVANVGTNSTTYTIDPVSSGSAGSYTCEVTDSKPGTPQTVTSDVAVLVWAAAPLVPALGFAALALMLSVFAVMGVRKLRKQS